MENPVERLAEARCARADSTAERHDRPATDGRPSSAGRTASRISRRTGDERGCRDPGRRRSPARRAVPARRRRRVQRRQERVHQRAARRTVAGGRRHADDGAVISCSYGEQPIDARPRARASTSSPRRSSSSRTSTSSTRRARTRSSASTRRSTSEFVPRVGPRAVRDVGRSSVHRDRAGVPGADSRLGQEGRRRHQQDRHLRARRQDVDEVRASSRSDAQVLLGLQPEIFPVSARLALRAKHGEPTLWAASRFEALERYIHDTLDEAQRASRSSCRTRSASAPRWRGATRRCPAIGWRS